MRFHRGPALSLLTLVSTLATAQPAVAQRTVTVGGAPAPGQSIRLTIVPDSDMNMKPTAAAAGSPLPTMHLKQKMTMVISQKVAAPDDKGAIGIQVTYEDISQDGRMTLFSWDKKPGHVVAVSGLEHFAWGEEH